MNELSSPYYYDKDGKEYFFEEQALAQLLNADVCFLNQRFYSMKRDGKSEGSTLVVFVICNDVFGWACADAENIELDEIKNLYDRWLKDKIWGPAKWVAIKRNLKPQKPVVEDMKKLGVWDEEMEKLGDNN